MSANVSGADWMKRVGKKAPGRLLGGLEYDQYAEVDNPVATVDREARHAA